VDEQISALRAVAGDSVVARIRRQVDPFIVDIVKGWPTQFDARRAIALGFRADESYEAIIQAHIEDELGGRFVA
jgi:hypothetical protein